MHSNLQAALEYFLKRVILSGFSSSNLHFLSNGERSLISLVAMILVGLIVKELTKPGITSVINLISKKL